jgi:hypothetical protein
MGLDLIFFDCLGVWQSLLELSRYVTMTTVTHIVLYHWTVVQDQSSIVMLYCCITSLPVYPSTIHGRCIVVLDTSDISILHCTTLKVNTVYCTCFSNWAVRVLYMVPVDMC